MLKRLFYTCVSIFLFGCSSYTPKYSSAEISSGNLARIYYNPYGESYEYRAILFEVKNIKNEVIASAGGSEIFDFYLEPGVYLFKTQCRHFNSFSFPKTLAKIEAGKIYRVKCENGKAEEHNGKIFGTFTSKVIEVSAADVSLKN